MKGGLSWVVAGTPIIMTGCWSLLGELDLSSPRLGCAPFVTDLPTSPMFSKGFPAGMSKLSRLTNFFMVLSVMGLCFCSGWEKLLGVLGALAVLLVGSVGVG